MGQIKLPSAKQGITEEERQLIFELVDGQPSLFHWFGHLRMICGDMKDMGFTGYMEILKWFKRQNLKGLNLVEWKKDKQGDSLLQSIAYARMKVYSDHKIRPIIGKNKI